MSFIELKIYKNFRLFDELCVDLRCPLPRPLTSKASKAIFGGDGTQSGPSYHELNIRLRKKPPPMWLKICVPEDAVVSKSGGWW